MSIKYTNVTEDTNNKIKLNKATSTDTLGTSHVDLVPTTLDSGNTDATITLSNGDLTATKSSGANWKSTRSVFSAASGLYYYEVSVVLTAVGQGTMIGVGNTSAATSNYCGADSNGWSFYNYDGKIWISAAPGAAYGAAFATNDVVGVALDLDNNFIYFAINGTWQNSGDPTSGASGTGAGIASATGTYFAYLSFYTATHAFTCNFGASSFVYTPPAGYTYGFGATS
jgi:hypothetical protein